MSGCNGSSWMLRLLVGASLVLFSMRDGARAQTLTDAQVATRDGLIRTAERAAQRGDHAAAVDAARRAGELRWSISLRRFLAAELQTQGDVAAALGQARQCEREGRASAVDRDLRHAVACASMAADLEQRVGRLVVVVPADPRPPAVVTVGGQPVPTVLLGVENVVNPGTQVIRVAGDGIRTWEQTVEVRAGARAEVRVEIREAEPRPPAPATVAARPTEAPPSVPPATHSQIPPASAVTRSTIVVPPQPAPQDSVPRTETDATTHPPATSSQVPSPLPSVPPVAEASGQQDRLRPAGIGLLVVVGASLAAGASLLGVGFAAGSVALSSGCGADEAGRPRGPIGIDCSGIATYRTLAPAGAALLGVGGAVLAGGIVTLVLSSRTHGRPARSFVCSPSLLGGVCGGSF